MGDEKSKTLSSVARYYSEKLAQFGESPQGVDWNGEGGQQLRFQQLCRIISNDANFSINDIGCGYGALVEYLERCYGNFLYQGCDVSSAMIAAAKKRNAHRSAARFIDGATPDDIADYAVASGIFNVRLEQNLSEWESYMRDTLDVMNATSREGFAFNCLTSYSDAEKMQAKLYYANPYEWFDMCKKRYSRNVALLHDYDLYEFTILVRKKV